MSKTKTLFTMALLVLVGSMGAAQAQDFAEVKLFTTPKDFAREGGKSEAAGSILLNSSAEAALQAAGAMIMLHFSVPLAADIAETTNGTTDAGEVEVGGAAADVVTGTAKNEDNDGNGTITIVPGSGAGLNLLIQGVMLDVSGADGPVTVTLKVTAGEDDFIRIDGPSAAMVIGGIKVGVDASAEEATVRTRGTMAGGMMASLTLKESFKGAFMTGNMVTVNFSGIPEGATLDAMVTSNPEDDATATPPVEAADLPSAMASAVKDGSTTVTLMAPANEATGSAPSSVTLGLTLTAETGDEDISFPMDPGSVMAKATFTDPTGDDDDFADAFTDYFTVFSIRPAQCELLFPVVTVLPDSTLGDWTTAISVTNPAYADEMAAGGLLFTFYGMGGVVAMYDTTVDTIVGVGLEDDGTLAPGGTYQVLANEILAATDWGEMFRGHVHLRADYTNCSGLGWVTNFMEVNQAYTATVIDADTGSDNQ